MHVAKMRHHLPCVKYATASKHLFYAENDFLLKTLINCLYIILHFTCQFTIKLNIFSYGIIIKWQKHDYKYVLVREKIFGKIRDFLHANGATII